jgi:MFS family permease
MLISTLRLANGQLLATLYEPVSKALGLNDLQFGVIRSAMDITAIVGALLFGVLADRWRRRDLIAIGVLGWSIATWLTGRVGNFIQLLGVRIGNSMFNSTFTVTAYPMLSDMVPRRSRGLVLGVLGTTFAIGTVIGLAVPALIGTNHWRQIFTIFAIPGLILGVFVLIFMREPRRGSAEDEVQEAAGYAGRFDWRVLSQTLRIRSVVLVWLLDACEAATWYAFAFWTPAYLLRQKIAPDADTAALALLPAIAGFVVGNVLGGWLTDRLRRKTQRSAVWVSLISMSGSLVMTVIVFAMRDVNLVMATGFIMGVFGHMIMAPVGVILYDVVPPETRSSATGADGLVSSAVSALTSFTIGAVSYYVGLWQGLSEGSLRTGFQGAVSVLLAVGIVVSLALLRSVPPDMQALHEHVAQHTVSVE